MFWKWPQAGRALKPVYLETHLSINIAGKIVVITGASSVLGEATARHLSREGAVVVPGARRPAH